MLSGWFRCAAAAIALSTRAVHVQISPFALLLSFLHDPLQRGNLSRHRSASEAEVDNEYVDTESSQDEFLPAQRDTGKGRPPNGHAIVRTNARYFQDWFSDHSPGLPTTPPDRISTRRAPTPETPEQAGCESPAWSDYDGSEDPYGEIPASWTSRPPGKSRRIRRPSPTTLEHDEDPY
ncbi:hypothetical protein JB92DRAFT_3131684 [Gautieria morchelliformis]|nr:hypothetical protein JB92DRAFT_3131684 [Gautieria morchelliformis]